MFALLILWLALSTHAAEGTAKLAPFRSDGCSAFPDGTIKQQQLWLRCCVEHDLAYWQGGTYDQRLHADRDLAQCVAATGEAKVAKLMLAGVRVGGSPLWPTAFRWGYGWPYFRWYGELSADEYLDIEMQLQQSGLDHYISPPVD